MNKLDMLISDMYRVLQIEPGKSRKDIAQRVTDLRVTRNAEIAVTISDIIINVDSNGEADASGVVPPIPVIPVSVGEVDQALMHLRRMYDIDTSIYGWSTPHVSRVVDGEAKYTITRPDVEDDGLYDGALFEGFAQTMMGYAQGTVNEAANLKDRISATKQPAMNMLLEHAVRTLSYTAEMFRDLAKAARNI